MVSLIKSEGLSKDYGTKRVLDQLDIDIQKSSLVAYLGTNGAGKTTTIKILTGLLKPSSGSVVRASDLKIGMVFQQSILDADLTVGENLNNRLKMYRHSDREWLQKIMRLTGIESILKERYKSLSGGQKRRVDIARALIHKPQLLFLDEPTTGLDIQSRQSIWNLFRQLQEQEGLTIFLTTHYLEEAENADMVYIIDQGKLLAKGSSQDLIHHYAKNRLEVTVMKSEESSPGSQPIEEILEFENVSPQEVIAILKQYELQLKDFDYQKGSLNDAFLAITGKEMES
ncbi:ABC transporter ATP-binding protein [Streptococcus uberis]|uniref:ABC transporter ATP-binding protein n=1 Tax=Streptococcus uberis TaxID=1349 RepID=UPI000543CFC4|nr:ABC transporter ATP-binding protein [Streptococcus uberis]KHD40428.1 ABC transporter ATP-binding protein [Streptococcus hongkongensis]SQG47074.1 ABC transporter ATP-binding protein [Streptococcus uberis]